MCRTRIILLSTFVHLLDFLNSKKNTVYSSLKYMGNLHLSGYTLRKAHLNHANVNDFVNLRSRTLQNRYAMARNCHQNKNFARNSNIKAHRVALWCMFFFLSVSLPLSLSQDMCCASTSYGAYDSWSMCYNAADETLGVPSSCETCVAYQCIDWLVCYYFLFD